MMHNLLRVTPLFVLYLLVTPTIWLLLRFAYRHPPTLALDNIKRCFPQLSPAEQRRIYRRNLRYFGILFAEILKGSSISAKALRRQFVIENPELISSALKDSNTVLILATHQGNWEWAALRTALLFPEIDIHLVYRPLHNPFFQRLMTHCRQRMGISLVDEKNAISLRRAKGGDKPRMVILAADQRTGSEGLQEEVMFFGHKTFYPQGPGRLARMFNATPIFAACRRDGLGRYKIQLHRICRPPKLQQQAPRSILPAYVRHMEKQIAVQPESYLWLRRIWPEPPPDKSQT